MTPAQWARVLAAGEAKCDELARKSYTPEGLISPTVALAHVLAAIATEAQRIAKETR